MPGGGQAGFGCRQAPERERLPFNPVDKAPLCDAARSRALPCAAQGWRREGAVLPLASGASAAVIFRERHLPELVLAQHHPTPAAYDAYSLSPLTAEILCSPEKDSLGQEQEMSCSRRRSRSASASHREGRQPGSVSPGDSGSYLGWTRGWSQTLFSCEIWPPTLIISASFSPGLCSSVLKQG